MLARKITEQLTEWKRRNITSRKTLLVTGARQIGKSYAIREFGKRTYRHYAEINLAENAEAREALAGSRTPQDFLNRLTLFATGLPTRGNTLVFIDEIQEAPDIMTMAKFLVEDGRYDYAFSGSMLGIDYKGVRSYPVGSVTELTMRPLDFEEFCWATGVSRSTIDLVRTSFSSLEPLDDHVHETLLRVFRTYLVVGGMPEVVQSFIDAGGATLPPFAASSRIWFVSTSTTS